MDISLRVPGIRRRLVGAGTVLIFGANLINNPAWGWQVLGALLLLGLPVLIFDVTCRYTEVLAIHREKVRLDINSQTFFQRLLEAGQIDQREYDYMMLVLARTKP